MERKLGLQDVYVDLEERERKAREMEENEQKNVKQQQNTTPPKKVAQAKSVQNNKKQTELTEHEKRKKYCRKLLDDFRQDFATVSELNAYIEMLDKKMTWCVNESNKHLNVLTDYKANAKKGRVPSSQWVEDKQTCYENIESMKHCVATWEESGFFTAQQDKLAQMYNVFMGDGYVEMFEEANLTHEFQIAREMFSEFYERREKALDKYKEFNKLIEENEKTVSQIDKTMQNSLER